LSLGREGIELTGASEFVEVEDEASDGDAEVCGLFAGYGAVGKALQREADSWIVGGVDPALLVPEVGLRLQGLTSGAEAHSVLLVLMARLKPCPFNDEPQILRHAQDDICFWVRIVLPTLR
jgi:hypothetical protein